MTDDTKRLDELERSTSVWHTNDKLWLIDLARGGLASRTLDLRLEAEIALLTDRADRYKKALRWISEHDGRGWCNKLIEIAREALEKP